MNPRPFIPTATDKAISYTADMESHSLTDLEEEIGLRFVQLALAGNAFTEELRVCFFEGPESVFYQPLREILKAYWVFWSAGQLGMSVDLVGEITDRIDWGKIGYYYAKYFLQAVREQCDISDDEFVRGWQATMEDCLDDLPF